MSETAETPKKGRPKKSKRVFKQTKKIFHDLFKLNVAVMRKNISWTKEVQIQDVEHVHFFHTYDSQGVKQKHCVATGGHFHIIETKEIEGEPPEILSVSGPMKWGSETDVMGKKRRVPVPVNPWDTHTHEIDYIESSEIKVRQTNSEALKVIGKNAATESKPGWVK